VEVRGELYIGGRWVKPDTDDAIDVIDSRTEEVMGSVPRGGGPEVEQAVAPLGPRLAGGPGRPCRSEPRCSGPSPTGWKRAESNLPRR